MQQLNCHESVHDSGGQHEVGDSHIEIDQQAHEFAYQCHCSSHQGVVQLTSVFHSVPVQVLCAIRVVDSHLEVDRQVQ
jgi:hypothetical protein